MTAILVTGPLALRSRDLVFGDVKMHTQKSFVNFFLFVFLLPLGGTAISMLVVMTLVIVMLPWDPVSIWASKVDPSHPEKAYLNLKTGVFTFHIDFSLQGVAIRELGYIF